MSPWIGPVASWLAEVYLSSTVLLAAAGLGMLVLRQPARRLVVARSALVALVLLAPLAAGAGRVRSLRCKEDAPAGVTPSAVPCQAARNGCCAGPSATLVPSSPMASASRNPIDSPGPSPEPNEIRLAAVLAAFAAGSGAMVAWLGLGAIASARLVDRRCVAPDRLRGMLTRIVGEGNRPPRLIICSRISHPVAVGLIDPSIVLPTWFAETEPEGRIEAALAHEWAHIRNGDLWLLAVSRLLLPLLFAHPLYAWLRRRMRADQEALADAAGAVGQGRIVYAEALLCWARARGDRVPSTLAPSLGLWERTSSLTGRVALLLDRDFRVEPTCPRLWSMGVSGAVAAVTVVLGLVLMNGSEGSTLAPSRPAQHVYPGGQQGYGVPAPLLCPQDMDSLATAVRCAG